MGECISILDKLNEKKEYENLINICNDDVPLFIVMLEPLDDDFTVKVLANKDFSKMLNNYYSEINDTVTMILADFDLNRISNDFQNESLNIFYLKPCKTYDGHISIDIIVNGQFEEYLTNERIYAEELTYTLTNIETDINQRLYKK